jgi:hypothetical protein
MQKDVCMVGTEGEASGMEELCILYSKTKEMRRRGWRKVEVKQNVANSEQSVCFLSENW